MNVGEGPRRGFILQASYRVNNRRAPVVHLYGRLENGDTFLVRDSRQRPGFYIPAAAAERARMLGAPGPQPTGKRSFAGLATGIRTYSTPSRSTSTIGGQICAMISSERARRC